MKSRQKLSSDQTKTYELFNQTLNINNVQTKQRFADKSLIAKTEDL